MLLRERLQKLNFKINKQLSTTEQVAEASWSTMYQEVKLKIHHELIEKIDLVSLTKIEGEKAREAVRRIIESLVDSNNLPLTNIQKRQLIKEVEDETFGLGPIEPLLSDPTVDDILVNNPKQIFVERFGKLELSKVTFRDDEHLMQIIERIVTRIGRRIDESSPMVDARLPDGSRVNAIIPPLALNGPTLSIRKFKKNPLTMEDLIRLRTLTPEIAVLLELAVKAKLNILISGGTGSGKTTLLNILSSYIPFSERIITIEDAAELQLHKAHVIRLETRNPNVEGKGEVTQRDLLRNSLRMRPDRIIIGEVRGPEALDMLQAMNTGHKGSLTTIHANSPRDALSRLETMILMAGANLSDNAMRRQIASGLEIVIQLERCSDGVRRIVSISEITGMEGDIVNMQEIFVFRQTGVTSYGEVKGQFIPTGVQPKFAEVLEAKGFGLSRHIFMPT